MGAGVLLGVVPECSEEGEEGEEGDGKGNSVEGRPWVGVCDEGGGDERAHGAAEAVAAVEVAQDGSVAGKVRAEGVVEGEVEGVAEAEEEET